MASKERNHLETKNSQNKADLSQPRATYASVTQKKKPTELAPMCVKEDEQSSKKEIDDLMKLKTLNRSQESVLMKQIESLVLENKVLRDSNRRLVEQYDNSHGQVSEIDVLTSLDAERAPVRYPVGDVRSIHLAKHAMREEEHYKQLKLAKMRKTMESSYDSKSVAEAMARRKMFHNAMANRYRDFPVRSRMGRTQEDWDALRLRARPFVPRSSLYRRY